ncbi:MAG: restriction endonuclease subunit S, partial [Treponema sp.]
DAEALFEQIQKGEVSPSLPSQVAPRIVPASSVDSLRFVGLSATPSPRGKAPKTPENSREFFEEKLDSECKRTNNARSKQLPPITDEEKPFEIPEGWKWVRLDDLFEHKTGKTLNGSKNKGTIIRKYITTSNLYWNYFDFDKVKEMEFTEDEIKKYSIQKGDLLVCEGGDVGRTAIWNFDYSVCYQNHIHRLRSYYPINIKFYYHILYLYKFSGYIDSQAKGMGIQGLSANRLGTFVLPLPPLKEQDEIVNKVETLLAKVTTLENQIQDRKSLSDKLIFGIIKENLEG